MTTYVCYFELNGKSLAARSAEGIGAFKDGFWLDEKYQYVRGPGCKYWIPPRKIDYIEAVRDQVANRSVA